MRHTIRIITASTLCFFFISLQANAAEKKHALSLFGKPKHSQTFQHFDYVNPKAVKAGTLRRLALRTYDSFNPFIIRGNAAAGLGLLYETLMTGSSDEVDTSAQYGLIAESVEVADDHSWVIYNLRPRARWHDGNPITAEDVAFSMNILKEKGQPFYRAYYQNVKKTQVLTNKRVKFTFDTAGNRELPHIVGQLTVLPKHYYADHDFAKTTLEPPLGSGPYRIQSFEPGRFIVYQRVEDYWGNKLPVNVGRYNFDKIYYEYYRDLTVAREAFKAHEFDIFFEYSSKGWATAYKFPAVEKGIIIREEIPEQTSPGMQALVFNTRREIFGDTKVRQAIGLAFDFEWLNKNIFFNQYKRTTSFFQNMELASSGLPEGLELKYLNRYKSTLPNKLFDEPFKLPVTSGSGNPREQFRAAKKLLREAGWIISDGVLKNLKNKKSLEFEILIRQPNMERVMLPFVKNLERLGVRTNIRIVDSSQYVQRLNQYDFDMVVTTYGQSFSPGNEQRNFWSSNAADKKGGRNLAGIKNPVIDAIIEEIILAPDRQHLVAATKALDRVLLWNHYVIPQFHSPNQRIAYWDRFGQPSTRPKFGVDIYSWWHDKDKLNRIERQKTR